MALKNFGTFVSNYHVSINQCYPKCGLGILESVHLHGILHDRHAPRTETQGKGRLGVVHLYSLTTEWTGKRIGWGVGYKEQVR